MRLVQLFGPDPDRLQPVGIRFGDVVYAANITGESMAAALTTARAILEEGGVGLDGLARATAYVRTPAEREPVYGPWDALFPDPANRPAFKVLLAPLPSGRAVRLDLLALAAGRRERIDIPGVSARDPTVRVGQWVLTSRVHGTDPATGAVASGGLAAEAHQAVANIATLAGSARISHLNGFVRDSTAAAALVDAVRADDRMPPVSVLTNFVPAAMNVMLEATAGVPSVREIFGGFASPLPEAVVIDNLFFAPVIDPSEGVDFRTQLRSALERMDATLLAAGLSRSAVAQVSVYFPTVDLKPILNEVWSEWFPDPSDRPPHKYVPDDLPENRLVQLQVFALRDSSRQILAIPGLVHGDPMSMGVRIAGQVFSSRLFGTDPSTGTTPEDAESQARIVFEHARTLLAQAGGTPLDVSQINAFITNDRDRAAIMMAFDQLYADKSSRPKLNFLSANLPGRSTVRIEVLGSVAPC